MTDLKKYWQAAQDFRSNNEARRIQGFASLMRLAGEGEGIPQQHADKLTRVHGAAVMRGDRPDFAKLTVVLPATLTR